ncbi:MULTISPECIES: hypothetical protein [Streptomyces]|uniref:hypothetical protein n=1 Tax=Streptomyces TaxID=1883 RepID=UPI000A4C66CF|nr:MULTISPECIES: hypothetical protein [Streptomyces]MDI5906427.1 hypothetical protein [Streptomyces sp. 12257]
MTGNSQPLLVKLASAALELNVDPSDTSMLGMIGIDPEMLPAEPELVDLEILEAVGNFQTRLTNLVPQVPESTASIEEWVGQAEPLPQVPVGQLAVPIAETSEPAFGEVFVTPDGLMFDLVPFRVGTDGDNEEALLVAISDDEERGEELVITLVEEGRELSDVLELPHVIAVTLRQRVPVVDGGTVVQEIPFSSVQFGDSEFVLIARCPLTTPAQRQQLLAALSSPESETTVLVKCGVTVGVPTGEVCEDGSPGFREQRLVLDSVATPEPLVLSDEQRIRMGGGRGGGLGAVLPMERTRLFHGDRSHSYWQDPVRPEHYYYLPDRFLLARLPDSGHRPALKVRAVSASNEADVRFTMEFSAQPVVEQGRLKEAVPKLEEQARAKGTTAPLQLEMLSEAQPVLRLALPQDGEPSTSLTEREGALIDLERGVTHAETLKLEDFRLVYEALFGASLSLLRGEVRIGAGGGPPEDIPLELRLDRTAGEVLALVPGTMAPDRISARLTNVIESGVHVEQLTAVAVCGADRLALKVEGVSAGLKLAPGESLDVQLVPEKPLPATGFDVIHLDEAGIVAEPDQKVVWELVFDRSVEARLSREVVVEAVAAQFEVPAGSADRVLAYVVTAEHGSRSVRLTESELKGSTTVFVPVEPLIKGTQAPPIRYQTETWWQSGGIGVSPWRETDHTILLPVKTAPPAGGGG